MAALSIRKLIRHGLGAVAIRFISAALGFALIFVMARWMLTDEFGYFGYGFSLAMTLSMFLDLGQRRLILRSLAAYRQRGRTDLMRGVLRFSILATFVGALAGALVVAIGAFAFDAHPSLYPTAVLTAAMILSDYQANLLRGLGNLYGSLLPREVVWRPLAIGVMAILGGGMTLVLSAEEALWILAICLLALSLVQLALVVRPNWEKVCAKIASQEKTDPEPDETLAQAKTAWWRSSGSLWLVSALVAGLVPASVVIVGWFVSPAETGAFFAAVRIATIIAFPLQGLNLLTSPMLASAYASGDKDRLQQVANFAAVASSAAALAGFVLLGLFGSQLLGLMDPAFVTSASTQLVIMAGFLIAALCGSSGQLMNMTGHDKEFMFILLVTNSVGIAALIAMSATMGGYGAAWALLAIKACWNVAVVLWARRYIQIDPSIAALVFPPAKAAT